MIRCFNIKKVEEIAKGYATKVTTFENPLD